MKHAIPFSSATARLGEGHGTTELLSRLEAAAYLGVKPQTLAVWASARRYDLPMVKVGRLAKYRLSDLDDFITAHLIGALPAASEPTHRPSGQRKDV